jgi:DNA-binding transcriptional ArsR family regulator
LQARIIAEHDIDKRQFPDYCWSMSEQSLNRLLQAIADPTRRRILQSLKERGACSIGKEVGLCACDVEHRIHLSQPTVSHHMGVLKKAGLVEARKQGQWMWYRRNEKTISELARQLRATL